MNLDPYFDTYVKIWGLRGLKILTEQNYPRINSKILCKSVRKKNLRKNDNN